MSDKHIHSFTWSGEANQVIVTGSFDDWNSSVPLSRASTDRAWTVTYPLAFGEKILYKFVVDGVWQHSQEDEVERDDAGNVNNVFAPPSLVVPELKPGTTFPSARAWQDVHLAKWDAKGGKFEILAGAYANPTLTYDRLRRLLEALFDIQGGYRLGTLGQVKDGRRVIELVEEDGGDAKVAPGFLVLLQPQDAPPPSLRPRPSPPPPTRWRSPSRTRRPSSSALPRPQQHTYPPTQDVLSSEDEEGISVRSLSTARSTDASVAPTEESFVHIDEEFGRARRASSTGTSHAEGGETLPWALQGTVSPGQVGGRRGPQPGLRRAWAKGKWTLDPQPPHDQIILHPTVHSLPPALSIVPSPSPPPEQLLRDFQTSAARWMLPLGVGGPVNDDDEPETEEEESYDSVEVSSGWEQASESWDGEEEADGRSWA